MKKEFLQYRTSPAGDDNLKAGQEQDEQQGGAGNEATSGANSEKAQAQSPSSGFETATSSGRNEKSEDEASAGTQAEERAVNSEEPNK